MATSPTSFPIPSTQSSSGGHPGRDRARGPLPAPDERVVAREVVYAGGGPAATAAVAAARLGVRTAFVGTVGDDANGRAILAGLADEGVDVSGVTVLAGHPSAASVVVVDRVRDTRAICNRRHRASTSAPAGPDRLQPRRPRRPRGLGAGRRGVLRAGQLLSVDAGNPIPGFTPGGVGLTRPPSRRSPHLRRRPPGADLLAQAVAEGCDTVVATDGARGSSALTATRREGLRPGAPGAILSTLGAGDVFHGALVAAVVSGLPLDQQLAFANVTAALSCRGLDGRSASRRWPRSQQPCRPHAH